MGENGTELERAEMGDTEIERKTQMGRKAVREIDR